MGFWTTILAQLSPGGGGRRSESQLAAGDVRVDTIPGVDGHTKFAEVLVDGLGFWRVSETFVTESLDEREIREDRYPELRKKMDSYFSAKSEIFDTPKNNTDNSAAMEANDAPSQNPAASADATTDPENKVDIVSSEDDFAALFWKKETREKTLENAFWFWGIVALGAVVSLMTLYAIDVRQQGTTSAAIATSVFLFIFSIVIALSRSVPFIKVHHEVLKDGYLYSGVWPGFLETRLLKEIRNKFPAVDEDMRGLSDLLAAIFLNNLRRLVKLKRGIQKRWSNRAIEFGRRIIYGSVSISGFLVIVVFAATFWAGPHGTRSTPGETHGDGNQPPVFSASRDESSPNTSLEDSFQNRHMLAYLIVLALSGVGSLGLCLALRRYVTQRHRKRGGQPAASDSADSKSDVNADSGVSWEVSIIESFEKQNKEVTIENYTQKLDNTCKTISNIFKLRLQSLESLVISAQSRQSLLLKDGQESTAKTPPSELRLKDGFFLTQLILWLSKRSEYQQLYLKDRMQEMQREYFFVDIEGYRQAHDIAIRLIERTDRLVFNWIFGSVVASVISIAACSIAALVFGAESLAIKDPIVFFGFLWLSAFVPSFIAALYARSYIRSFVSELTRLSYSNPEWNPRFDLLQDSLQTRSWKTFDQIRVDEKLGTQFQLALGAIYTAEQKLKGRNP